MRAEVDLLGEDSRKERRVRFAERPFVRDFFVDGLFIDIRDGTFYIPHARLSEKLVKALVHAHDRRRRSAKP